jgi:hypothetical protein
MCNAVFATPEWFFLTAVGSAVGQLHALARHAAPDGQEDLDSPLTRAWAVPAACVLQPLLDWSDPMTMSLSYGRVWLPVSWPGCSVRSWSVVDGNREGRAGRVVADA